MNLYAKLSVYHFCGCYQDASSVIDYFTLTNEIQESWQLVLSMLLGEQDHLMKNCFKYTLIQKGEFIKLFPSMDFKISLGIYLLQPI